MEADPIRRQACTAACDDGSTCPENGYCIIFDGDDGHLCAPLCQSDADCAAISPDLYCSNVASRNGAFKTCSTEPS